MSVWRVKDVAMSECDGPDLHGDQHDGDDDSDDRAILTQPPGRSQLPVEPLTSWLPVR
jgi:hypothetical protein